MNFKKFHKIKIFSLILVFSVVLLTGGVVFAENIDPDNDGSQYAWGENAGWINFEPLQGPGVTVTNTAVTGMAWGENIGWINLSPTFGGVINDGSGNLSGYAWGENTGWINFNPTGGGVTINSFGVFNGYAWGENTGWINFNPSTWGGVKTSYIGGLAVPTMTQWGMIIFMVLAGFGSIYYLRRQRIER